MEELIGFILQILWEFFGELILQVVVQFVVELFVRFVSSIFSDAPVSQTEATVKSVTETINQTRAHPAAIWVLYATLGAVIGFISVWAHPAHFIRTVSHRWLNLVITPLISGWTMAALGHWHQKRGDRVVGMDKFFNGWGFALAFAVVRFVWCR